ncbi:MAG: transcriptional regulator [Acidobacteria bacterium]|nr:transcriptional regulator [Acidobacteriota bacterium]MYE43219.1 transcriptional regulator [Acidobacteriota bacterium]
MTPYSDTELESLMLDLESDRVERKESATEDHKIRRNICAFANDLPGNQQPGVLLIGVEDDGACASLPITDDLLKRLSNIHGEGSILPLPSMTVQRRTLRGCEVAVVTVAPSVATPVRYRGRVWVRIGPSVRQASAEDERLLTERRRAADLPFDMRPASGAALEDLDLDSLRRVYFPAAISPNVLDANTRSLDLQLRSLRLMREDRPTWGSVLAFGRDPQAWIPGAYVQFLRIAGDDTTDAIQDQKQITGPLSDVLRRLDEIIELHIQVRTRVAGVQRERQQPDYPADALRQLVRNAIMHRSYEATNTPVRIHWYRNRVEIVSPGGLYGRMTPENFGSGDTDYRNPLVAEIMHNLGFSQRFGLGVRLAREALAQNGNPQAKFEFQSSLVAATVRGAS